MLLFCESAAVYLILVDSFASAHGGYFKAGYPGVNIINIGDNVNPHISGENEKIES